MLYRSLLITYVGESKSSTLKHEVFKLYFPLIIIGAYRATYLVKTWVQVTIYCKPVRSYCSIRYLHFIKLLHACGYLWHYTIKRLLFHASITNGRHCII